MRLQAELGRRIEQEINEVAREFNHPPFSVMPHGVRNAIADYLSRKGKRLRPRLFVSTYAGYSTKRPSGLYTAAVALEILHDFILIHDDIIDRSNTRRKAPALHVLIQDHLPAGSSEEFNGENAAIVIGDMMYALGIRLFLAIGEHAKRKEKAVEYLTRAAVYTSCGEMKELLDARRPVEDVSADDIIKSCQWKTAYYSFACPTLTAAILSGAPKGDRDTLGKYALSMGLAYQIRNDILDLTDGKNPAGNEADLEDLREGKRTLPLWYAVNNADANSRSFLKEVLATDEPVKNDLEKARNVIINAGGIEYAAEQVARLVEESFEFLDELCLDDESRNILRAETAAIMAITRDRHVASSAGQSYTGKGNNIGQFLRDKYASTVP